MYLRETPYSLKKLFIFNSDGGTVQTSILMKQFVFHILKLTELKQKFINTTITFTPSDTISYLFVVLRIFPRCILFSDVETLIPFTLNADQHNSWCTLNKTS